MHHVIIIAYCCREELITKIERRSWNNVPQLGAVQSGAQQPTADTLYPLEVKNDEDNLNSTGKEVFKNDCLSNLLDRKIERGFKGIID